MSEVLIRGGYERPGIAGRLALWKGVLRRLVLRLFNPGHVKKSLARREGQCGRCGACCRLLLPRCMYLKVDDKGQACCTKHRGLRPGNCKVFPIDERDIYDRNLISGASCGYRFSGFNHSEGADFT